jgi:hypothetical protein
MLTSCSATPKRSAVARMVSSRGPESGGVARGEEAGQHVADGAGDAVAIALEIGEGHDGVRTLALKELGHALAASR